MEVRFTGDAKEVSLPPSVRGQTTRSFELETSSSRSSGAARGAPGRPSGSASSSSGDGSNTDFGHFIGVSPSASSEELSSSSERADSGVSSSMGDLLGTLDYADAQKKPKHGAAEPGDNARSGPYAPNYNSEKERVRGELKRKQREQHLRTGQAMMNAAYVQLIKSLEVGNKSFLSKFLPFAIHLDGWAQHVQDNIEEFEEVLLRIWQLYFDEYGFDHPLMELALLTFFSGLGYSMGQQALAAMKQSAAERGRDTPGGVSVGAGMPGMPNMFAGGFDIPLDSSTSTVSPPPPRALSAMSRSESSESLDSTAEEIIRTPKIVPKPKAAKKKAPGKKRPPPIKILTV